MLKWLAGASGSSICPQSYPGNFLCKWRGIWEQILLDASEVDDPVICPCVHASTLLSSDMTIPQKISYLKFWTMELKSKIDMTHALKMIAAITLWFNQISSAIKIKWTSLLNRHYFTDTTVSQRIRLIVSHNTALPFKNLMTYFLCLKHRARRQWKSGFM